MNFYSHLGLSQIFEMHFYSISNSILVFHRRRERVIRFVLAHRASLIGFSFNSSWRYKVLHYIYHNVYL